MSLSVTLLVLNYNGRDHLANGLPSIIEAAAFAGLQHRVAVVDNASTDDSQALVEQKFPSVHWMGFSENRYLYSFNEAVAACHSSHVMLLNNDIRVERDFLLPLIEIAQDPRVFAVQPKMLNWAGDELNSGRKRIYYLYYGEAWIGTDVDAPEELLPTAFASGGAMLCARDRFLSLGGFDPLFFPIYSEDVDLSYRAWRRAWQVLWDPRSIVYHHDHATYGKYHADYERETLRQVHRFLFQWKNINDSVYWQKNLLLLFPRLAGRILQGNRFYLYAFFSALKRLPMALRARSKAETSVLSDREIESLTSQKSFKDFQVLFEKLTGK